MSGGMAMLVATGPENEFLNGSPEVSFFRSSYRAYTNYSRVTDRQVIEGTKAPGAMSKVRFEKKGDLLSYCYITAVDLSQNKTITTHNWLQYIDHIDLYIGGALIDSHDCIFDMQVGIDTLAQNLSMSAAGGNINGINYNSEFYPLRFFFCENANNCLPICALQNHDVEIQIHWGKNVLVDNLSFEFYASFIFLDREERHEVMTKSTEMLITQVQKLRPSNTNILDLPLSHPIKFLASANMYKYDQVELAKGNQVVIVDYGLVVTSVDNFGNETYDPNTIHGLVDYNTKVVLQINGEDVGPYKYTIPHYTSVMSYYHTPFAYGNEKNHFLMPFALDTSKLQPSGCLNFSRLDSARLVTDNRPIRQPVYAVNYNVLHIEKGMAGLLYAN